jgi:hypothetical protein
LKYYVRGDLRYSHFFEIFYRLLTKKTPSHCTWVLKSVESLLFKSNAYEDLRYSQVRFNFLYIGSSTLFLKWDLKNLLEHLLRNGGEPQPQGSHCQGSQEEVKAGSA